MLTNLPIWVGAYGPEMLDLVSRKADGWLPTLHHLVHVLGNELGVTGHPG